MKCTSGLSARTFRSALLAKCHSLRSYLRAVARLMQTRLISSVLVLKFIPLFPACCAMSFSAVRRFICLSLDT